MNGEECDLLSFPQTMSKATCITFDGSILVESKQLKGVDILRIQPIGSRKEFLFKFDVGLPTSFLSYLSPSLPPSLIPSPTQPNVKELF